MSSRETHAAEPEKDRGLTRTIGIIAFLVGIIAAIVINLTVEPPSVWGLVPIVLYAILALLGLDIVLATLGALIAAVIMTGTGPLALSGLFAQSLGSFIVTVGLIIILGGGLGRSRGRPESPSTSSASSPRRSACGRGRAYSSASC
jgi:hypothetical protein